MTAWLCAGRSSEVAWTTIEGLQWDELHQCVFSEIPQSKTSKVKEAPFMAGVNGHSCWLVAFGDSLAMEPTRKIYDPGEANWLNPLLQNTGTPGATLGSWIKALQPSNCARVPCLLRANLAAPSAGSMQSC
jgi:hypothetical protein